MDFYIAAIGRSGSTALSNWLTTPPTHFVFHEPNLLGAQSTRLLALQLADWNVTAEEVLSRHWAVKEVEPQKHQVMIATYRPDRVMVCVRSLHDVALSFFEKHRKQGYLERYSDEWTRRFIHDSSMGLVDLVDFLEREHIPWRTVRYEEFTRSSEALRRIADWVGWPGGGQAGRGLSSFDRTFELDRHGGSLRAGLEPGDARALPAEPQRLARVIAEENETFARMFY